MIPKFLRFLLPYLALLPFGSAASTGKPNILFIAVDDLKPMLGCYGDATVRSPSIDRLAEQGVTFTHAYCMQAVCAPSRNAVFTGLRPGSLRIYDLETFFRTTAPDVVTLPQYFKQQGWQSQAIGKLYHTAHGNKDDPASWSVPLTRPKGGYALAANQGPGGLQPPVECADVADNIYPDGQVADLGIERLRGFRKSGEPFFLGLGSLKPHLPFTAPKKYWDLYHRSDFKVPTRTTLPEGAPAFAGTTFGELRKYSDVPAVGPLTDEQGVELIHGYHAAVSFVDAQIGRVLAELDQLGLRENTIVVLWGDHGWHLGDHGLWCKHTDYEEATRAPLIISAPGRNGVGVKSASVVELVDLYPTLCELAGLPLPPHLQGISLAPLLDNPAATVGDAAFHVFPRNVPGKGEVLGQAVRTGRYRYVEWQAADQSVVARELYDFQSDAGETVNLADQAEHAATVKELSAKILARLNAPAPAGVTLRLPAKKAKVDK